MNSSGVYISTKCNTQHIVSWQMFVEQLNVFPLPRHHLYLNNTIKLDWNFRHWNRSSEVVCVKSETFLQNPQTHLLSMHKAIFGSRIIACKLYWSSLRSMREFLWQEKIMLTKPFHCKRWLFMNSYRKGTLWMLAHGRSHPPQFIINECWSKSLH